MQALARRCTATRLIRSSIVSPVQRARSFWSSRPLKMASDEDYMAFLAKANQPVAPPATTTTSTRPQLKAVDEGMQVPKVISEAIGDVVYTSEADEPFHGVSLRWSGDGLPNEEEFAKLVQHWDDRAEVDILDPADWDSRGEYAGVIDAVSEATRGNDVRVYRVVVDVSRVEYWVVSASEGRIVGVKALGVES